MSDRQFVLGESSGEAVRIDIDSLLRTRMLIQANSGGGKSWLLRRILERSHGMVQQIVIDLEGEFSTLRERYDYILVGKGGEVHPDPRYAREIAEKILELGVSAVVDLFELRHHERQRFVKLFLEAMINVRKELWRPCLVVVDEAHQFCPEGKESEATSAVIDLCTRGRKRSFAAILATQRLAKLHKDAAAECMNKLMGRTTLDIDRKRAGEEIGFTDRQQVLGIRDLEAGEFYAYGPAMSKDVRRVVVGKIETTHPDIGRRATAPPPPREKVRRVLEQLASLPKEAEERQLSERDLREKVQHLERELKRHKMHGTVVEIPQAILDVKIDRALAADRKDVLVRVQSWRQAVLGVIAENARGLARSIPEFEMPALEAPPAPVLKPRPEPSSRARVEPRSEVARGHVDPAGKRILDIIATLELRRIEPTVDSVARWLDLHPRGGSYRTALARLRSGGLLDGWELTEAGRAVAVSAETGVRAAEVALRQESRRRIFRAIEDAGSGMSLEELAGTLGLHPRGGSFRTDLARLRTMGLVTARGLIELTEGARR